MTNEKLSHTIKTFLETGTLETPSKIYLKGKLYRCSGLIITVEQRTLSGNYVWVPVPMKEFEKKFLKEKGPPMS